ncbi:MAG: undecaprenyl-phosphate glucose phosphotransferase [Haliea sp.]|uniref:undecaprenyl-phosphate glucose phosphotransferase n=1 Tax=Haliea sp. TaxID=1932666 RepID=UPI000C443673|nr:undecaprenyl-phosphate glucose phosphotransferase [Haliea sp.]MBM68591.1 undecaprenyl-phosphate glucose phosphotransferase [Haliea sp.]|tara:strand:+ start:15704 stop:17077 length:1374 start_codon:yes stop_codon:yes gene_type:complete
MTPANDIRLARFAPLLDALALTSAGALSWYLRFGAAPVEEHYPVALLLGFLMALVLLPLAGAYRRPRWSHPVTGLLAAAPGILLLYSGLLLVASLTKTTADFSRIWMVGWGLLGIVAMACWRLLLDPVLRQGARNIAMLGTGHLACSTVRHLQTNSKHNRVTGMLRLPGENPVPADSLPAALLGELDDLEPTLISGDHGIDEIWLAPDATHAIDDAVLLTRIQQISLPVHYVPDLTLLRILRHRVNDIDGVTLIELNATALDGPEAVLKRIMDYTLSALALLLLAPLLVLLAILVRLESPGPALFVQARHGGGGRIIQVFKFRTMREGACPDRQATRDDPRITRLGAFLRRSSLDELPQLFNVLRGDMSLVGPRPHPLALNEQFGQQLDTYMQRHRVKPGITGWAQINGFRGETDTLEKMQSRLEYDIHYIENWSLWLDIKILARTALMGWTGRNAY